MAGFLKIPFRLLRFPATLVAVVVASLLLALAGGASPLFVDSAGNAAFERSILAGGGSVPAFELRRTSQVTYDVLQFRDAVVRRNLDLPGLGEPIIAGIGSLADVSVGDDPRRSAPVRVVMREGAFEHLELLEGGTGEGVWLADRAARALRVGAGDRISLSRLGDPGTLVRVAAIYHDLAIVPRDPFWTPFGGIIYPPDSDSPAPPSFLVVTPDDFLVYQPPLLDRAEFVWDVPLKGAPTLAEARVLADDLQRIGGELSDETTQIGSALSSANYQTPVPTWVGSADRTVAALVTPVDTISLAGRGVALGVVIAAGIYVVRRRRVEFALLHARGVAPARLGARVGVESALPLAAGAALGAAAAVGLIRWLGPGRFTQDAVREAVTGAAIGAGVGLVAIAISAALAVRSLDESGGGRLRGVVSRVPWEAVLLTLAGAALYEAVIRGGQPLIAETGEVQIDRLLLLFPLLFLAGGAGMVVRLLRRIMPRLRKVGAGGSPALYLSSRRLAGAPRTAGLLITASALGLGMLAYAALLSSSIRGSAEVKAHVAVGSDVAVDLAVSAEGLSIPRSTGVMVLPDVHLSPGGEEADLLGVDRATFRDGAFWDGSFGMSVDRFLEAVRPSGETLRAVFVRSGADLKDVSVAGTNLPVSVAARLDAFPGTARTRSLVVVDQDALRAALADARVTAGRAPPTFQLWAHGDPDGIRRRIEAAGRAVDAVRSVDEVRETPAFQSLSWTFGFLEALGVAAGAIALVGLVLYLQTRQRAREISYALARRMGLTRGAHRRSVAIELAGMLVTAFLVGAGLAFAAALLVYKRFDPLPSLPPGAVLRIPVAALSAAGGAIVLAAWVGSRLVQRRADRANVAEVMRAA